MTTEARRRANARYNKASMRSVTVGFSPVDHDVHDWLTARAKAEGKSAAKVVREVLRAEMEREGGSLPESETP